MTVVGDETCPLPADPTLAAAARSLNEAGLWAEVFDAEWRGVHMTDDARLIYGGRVGLAPYPVGAHLCGPERVTEAMAWQGGQFPLEIQRRATAAYSPWLIADTPGGREELLRRVDPRLRDAVAQDLHDEPPAVATLRFQGIYTGAGTGVDVLITFVRLRRPTGELAGTATLFKPAVGMSILARMTALGDLRHFRRMDAVAGPGRRPAAVLFADLESSSALARRLSTARYFAVIRRLARAADHAVIDAGGLVGRHAGDGVVGFFLAEVAGAESRAAEGCIAAARRLRASASEVAGASGLAPDDVVLRFGLHWGSNLYVGQIATPGRTEVTALGDEVNETARIEACATGGRILASKSLVERLDRDDAVTLGIDLDRVTYTPLAQLSTATEKARRDAPAVPVCEI